MLLLPIDAPQVLLIEDDSDLLEALYAMLTEEGFQVTMVASCTEAQVLLGQEAFDVVCTDLFRPPHGTLFSTLEMVRYQVPKTPMMIMTAWPLTPEAVALRGYQGVLSKPFEREAPRKQALVCQDGFWKEGGMSAFSLHQCLEQVAASEGDCMFVDNEGAAWTAPGLLAALVRDHPDRLNLAVYLRLPDAHQDGAIYEMTQSGFIRRYRIRRSLL